jgi:hypothetical protein
MRLEMKKPALLNGFFHLKDYRLLLAAFLLAGFLLAAFRLGAALLTARLLAGFLLATFRLGAAFRLAGFLLAAEAFLLFFAIYCLSKLIKIFISFDNENVLI